METQNVIIYKWNQGVYSLEDMKVLVRYNKLTPDKFFDITRIKYLDEKNQTPDQK